MMTSSASNPEPKNGAGQEPTQRRIGDFEILDEIGRGGMGVVFRARQVSLDRFVALKILSSSLGISEEAIIRFRREAQSTAKLYHPNIVPIYAQGQDGQTYYYAMQLVSGQSLHDILVDLRRTDEGTVLEGKSSFAADLAHAETRVMERSAKSAGGSPSVPGASAISSSDSAASLADASRFDEIARQIRGVADALEFAHLHGVIHRDIKPHNLLLGEQNRLCLSDFGLARVLEQPGLTVSGEFVGSPLYMSPEQISGHAGQVGPATDIYSLGATLYEWLTLRPPFPGQTREEVISKVLIAEVVPPRNLNPAVPLDLETICLKALEKDPARRYRSAGDMRDDLQRFLDRSGIKARRAGPIARLGKLISRRPVETTIVVAAALVLVLSALLVREKHQTDRLREHRPIPHAANVPAPPEATPGPSHPPDPVAEVASALRGGEEIAKALNLNLVGLLPSSKDEGRDGYQPVNDAQRVGAMFLTWLRQAETRRLKKLPAGSVDPRYLQALTQDRPAREVLPLLETVIEDAPELIEPRLLRAWIACQLSDFPTMLAEADAIRRLDPRRSEADIVRGAALLLSGKYQAARDALDVAIQFFNGNYRLDILRGMTLAALQQNDVASAALSRALILAPDSVLALLQRAKLSRAGGLYEHAVADLTHVIQLEPDNAEAYELRGACFDKLERYDDALDEYTRAFEISHEWELLAKLAAVAAKRDQQRVERERSPEPPEANTGGLPQTPHASRGENALTRFHEKIRPYWFANDLGYALVSVASGARNSR